MPLSLLSFLRLSWIHTDQAGFVDGNMAGMVISLTAIRQWLRNDALKDQITDEVLTGKKKICLAVTEAFAGSDVAGLRTTATKTPDGKHYIVNGTKYVTANMAKAKLTSVPVLGSGSQMAPLPTTLSRAAARRRASRCS